MRVLGFCGDQIAIYDRERANIRYVKDTAHRPSVLLSIAGLIWLSASFPAGGSRGFDPHLAADWVNRSVSRRGYFDDLQIRGRGASKVSGKLVFHVGDSMLTGFGVRALTDADECIFPQDPKPRLPACEPATAKEGADPEARRRVFGGTTRLPATADPSCGGVLADQLMKVMATPSGAFMALVTLPGLEEEVSAADAVEGDSRVLLLCYDAPAAGHVWLERLRTGFKALVNDGDDALRVPAGGRLSPGARKLSPLSGRSGSSSDKCMC